MGSRVDDKNINHECAIIEGIVGQCCKLIYNIIMCIWRYNIIIII